MDENKEFAFKDMVREFAFIDPEMTLGEMLDTMKSNGEDSHYFYLKVEEGIKQFSLQAKMLEVFGSCYDS